MNSSHHWVTHMISTSIGDVPVIATRLVFADRVGTWKVRWGIGRMSYTIPPGLYAIGNPDSKAPVFVTANFKMSFDRVRQALDGRNAWLLILDTKGINVWCAAGKGSFGTDEVIRQIESTQLARVVSHRTLILPQLSAPGVASHQVTQSTKFHVIFGPVRAEDIPAFLAAGLKAAPELRRVRFSFKDRLILTPVELTTVIRNPYFLAALGLWAARLAGVRFIPLDGLAFLGAVVVGTVAVPALLPWIPGRPFAFKGWLLGLLWAVAVCAFRGLPIGSAAGWAAALSYIFLLPALSAFLAMNFTGSSTFTSLSGVVREMKYALPSIILSATLGVAALVTGLFI
jgi:hypothetical protein